MIHRPVITKLPSSPDTNLATYRRTLLLICTDFVTEVRIERADIDTALLVEFNGSQCNTNFLLKVLRHQSITMPIFQYPSEGKGNLH